MSLNKQKIAIFGKVLSCVVALLLVVTLVPKFSASAVSYIGSGTKADPYLVTNAEQLDGMRNNLSAHYKLAATIDMSSFGNMEPIGFLAKPFTGSFVCDIAEDGLPYYAIKNLSVNNKRGLINKHAHATANFPDYVKDNSHWEAGLFGATEGATLKGIYVLDANIINSCVGELSHTYPGGDKSKDYIPCPGGDENATGVLIAIASGTTIQGCMTSGKIDSMTNHTGGMVGLLKKDSSIYESYSTVNVKSGGCWGAGGLVGTGKDISIQYCFATGNVDAPMKKSFEDVYLDLSGGIVGVVEGTGIISDCYSTGTISFNGNSLASIDKEEINFFSNCYTISKVQELTATPTDKKNSNNCFVLAEAGCKQSAFNAATADEINAAFSGLEGWETGKEKYPTLSKVKVVSDSGIYVAGGQREGVTPPATQQIVSSALSDSSENSNGSSGGETTSQGDTTSENTADGTTQTVSVNSTEKQVLMIVLAALIIVISVLTSVVFITIIKKLGREEE